MWPKATAANYHCIHSFRISLPYNDSSFTSFWQNISYSVKEANSLSYMRCGLLLGGCLVFSFAAPPAPQEVLCCHCSMGFSLPVPLEETTPKGAVVPVQIALPLLGELWYGGSEVTLSFSTFTDTKNVSCF